MSYHKAELNIDQESPAKVRGQSSPQHKNISDALVPVMSRSHRNALTKDLVRNLVFEDKEPFSVFERPGFRKCVERLNSAYTLPSMQTVAEVADAIADECLTDVKTILKQHVDDGGTICLAADCWTKKRRKFIANIAYFFVKWRLIRAVISCKAVPTGQSVTAEKLVVNVEVKLFVSNLST